MYFGKCSNEATVESVCFSIVENTIILHFVDNVITSCDHTRFQSPSKASEVACIR